MVATTVSSSVITNLKKNGTTAASTYNALGSVGDARLKSAAGTMEIAMTSIDEANDTVILFRLKGTDQLQSLVLFNDDLDTNAAPALTVDVGIYKDVSADGTSATAVDADAIAAAATTLQAANKTGAELRFATADINTINKAVWELGSETAATSADRYIGLRVVTPAATAATGTISWKAVIVSA